MSESNKRKRGIFEIEKGAFDVEREHTRRRRFRELYDTNLAAQPKRMVGSAV